MRTPWREIHISLPRTARMQASALTVAVEALSAELRATEGALAHWREDANRLRAQLRALRHTSPADEVTAAAPKSLLPFLARPREGSGSSVTSMWSTSTVRGRREAVPDQVPSWLTREFWDPKANEEQRRRGASAAQLQARWRGVRQRRRYASARAFFAIVNGVIELRSGGRSVPAYTLTVVRGGHCWQVHHRFSDWVELDRQLAARLPDEVAWVRPGLPSRLPFRSRTVTSHRQYALNKYLHKMLILVDGCTMARRTLLNFVSRSHMHWMYANDAVLLAPPTAARLDDVRAEQAREMARASLFAASEVPMHRASHRYSEADRTTNGLNGGGGGLAPWLANGGDALNGAASEVRDASTGTTHLSAAAESRLQQRRGLLG